MKKKSITLGVVFCIFILCSLTYQPIIANESLDTTLNNESVSYDIKSIRVNHKLNIFSLSSITKNDNNCECEKLEVTVICHILFRLLIVGLLLSMLFDIDIIGIIADFLGRILNCW
jgi:hypothetical protein